MAVFLHLPFSTFPYSNRNKVCQGKRYDDTSSQQRMKPVVAYFYFLKIDNFFHKKEFVALIILFKWCGEVGVGLYSGNSKTFARSGATLAYNLLS